MKFDMGPMIHWGYPLGTFTCKSGKLIVSDPCYEKGLWCQGTIKNARPGTWEAYAAQCDEGDWGKRIAALIVRHQDWAGKHWPNPVWKIQEKTEIGVDAGHAGFFDDSVYPNKSDEKEDFNDTCFHVRYRENGEPGYIQAGIIDGGAVSSSGDGDGGYRLATIEENGQTVAAVIDYYQFIEVSRERRHVEKCKLEDLPVLMTRIDYSSNKDLIEARLKEGK